MQLKKYRILDTLSNQIEGSTGSKRLAVAVCHSLNCAAPKPRYQIVVAISYKKGKDD